MCVNCKWFSKANKTAALSNTLSLSHYTLLGGLNLWSLRFVDADMNAKQQMNEVYRRLRGRCVCVCLFTKTAATGDGERIEDVTTETITQQNFEKWHVVAC